MSTSTLNQPSVIPNLWLMTPMTFVLQGATVVSKVRIFKSDSFCKTDDNIGFIGHAQNSYQNLDTRGEIVSQILHLHLKHFPSL